MFKTILTGNIGNDAEVTSFDNGSKVVTFSVAHSKKWTDKAGVKQEKTTWIRCNMWKQENLAQYLKKGVRVMVEGEIEARAYTNKEGQTVASLELNVFAIEMQSFAEKSNEGATAVSTPPQNLSTPPQAVSTPPVSPTTVNNTVSNTKFTPANEEESDLPF
jgi:single-strand DNA-binding protein